MAVLIIGLAIFLGMHLTRLIGVKAAVAGVIGETLWAVFYTILSAIGLALTVYGYILAHPSAQIWAPPEWTRTLALLSIPAALVLIAAAYAPSHIRNLTRHPMTLGVFLWAGAHLLANGEMRAVVLFGAFTAWSGLLLIEGYARGGQFARPGAWIGDAAALIVGLGLAALTAIFHMQLFGVAVVSFASDAAPTGI